MEVKDFQFGDEKDILSLFEITFGRFMRQDVWQWRFQNNPAGRFCIKLMWENDKLVGHYAVSPFDVNIDSGLYQASLSMTTMTHPDYNGRGFFKVLATELYKTIYEQYDIKLVMGYPNKNSHYGFIKNLKWKDLAVVHHLVLDTSCLKRVKSDQIFLTNNFRGVHASLLKRISSAFCLSVERSVEYLNWRYVDNPLNKYYIFEYVDDVGLRGFLVVKLYSMLDGTYGLFIMENGIEGENISLLPIFLSHIFSFFSEKISTINTWLPLFDRRHIFYEKNGFMLGGKPTYWGVRFLDPKFDLLGSDVRNWYYSYGDSDVY
ncbi:GNAT family N-acetyltransferase [Butyricimonas virosa]|uniref:GNAT family N-acetyltransferase n=1 Tax=Butyricimonas virosa TaxID=544645 RepID=UPI000EC3BC03|nr:hypothetical protein [Butyricimonas virosa]